MITPTTRGERTLADRVREIARELAQDAEAWVVWNKAAARRKLRAAATLHEAADALERAP